MIIIIITVIIILTLIMNSTLIGDKGTLCVQWQGPGLRYQADRKFESLEGGGIRTFELTEIASENAGVNYFE